MNYFFLLLCFTLFIGCQQKPQVHHYTEVSVDSPSTNMSSSMGQDPHAGLNRPAAMGQDPHAGLDMSAMMGSANEETKNMFAWKTPEGWMEMPGNGMRIATFHLADKPQDIDISIVSMGGMAGGLESNIKRWLGQINVQISDDQLKSFIQSSQGNVFNFSQLQKGQAASSKSMIAAMLSLKDMTVFVKMAGSIEAVNANKEKFMGLAQSVQLKQGAVTGGLQKMLPMGNSQMPPMMFPTENNAVEGKLKWSLPQAWQELPASGMRLATFHLVSDPTKIDCSIVTLAGQAGGIEANVSRWMEQVGVKSSPENLEQFINSSQSLKTQGGQDVKIYDFTFLQKNALTSDKSMMATIISIGDVSIFVKMTGSIEAVKANQSSFIELVKSIQNK